MPTPGISAPPGVVLVESQTWFDNAVTVTRGGSFTANGPMTAQSLSGTGTVPSAAAGAGAGTGAATSSRVGHDIGGSFVLTAGTTPAAGVVATVTFGTALSAAPVSVVVSCVDTTANAPVDVGAAALATTGFSVYGPALTASHTYLISYVVVAS